MSILKTYTPTVTVAENKQIFAKTAALLLWEQLEEMHNPLMVLPTGNTPGDMYRYLVTHHGKRKEIWERVRFLALDEYIGLPANDRRLFQNWLARDLLDPVGIPVRRRIVFNSMADAPGEEAAAMENWIKDNGPIDIAVLGLGVNGHIAFNEPGSNFDSVTRVIALSPETRQSNAAYWGGLDKVPERAYTLGLRTLSNAKQIILLVNGAHKAEILNKVLCGPITPDIPASFLRTVANVTVLADREAAKDLL